MRARDEQTTARSAPVLTRPGLAFGQTTGTLEEKIYQRQLLKGDYSCGAVDEKAVVEILEPPADAEDGERAFVEGADGDAATANQVKKKKFWPPVAEKLAMAGGVATFDGQAISTSEGPCTCPSVADGMLS